jgi:predicted DNA-binding transcriptional regulator AlpA
MTLREFCARNGVSKITVWRLRQRGMGPKIVKLGLRRIGVTYEAERDWQENSPIVRENLDRHPPSGDAWHRVHRKKRKRRVAQASAESGTGA